MAIDRQPDHLPTDRSSEASRRDELGTDFRGLDALELPAGRSVPTGRRIARAIWPKLLAIAIFGLAWEAVVLARLWPTYLLPGPVTVLSELASEIGDGTLVVAIGVTMRRALTGYLLAAVIGILLGLAVSRSRLLRDAIGSLITGLQTMPSIAWFPLAILLFQLSETAILFVVVLGAAPAIANGLIGGVDHVPPLLVRAGRVLGARGIATYRYIILPAALPTFVAGLKQGWAFAWRSLMAGELLVIVAGQPSIGVRLQLARDLLDVPQLLATMLVILAIGILVDALVFSTLERSIRARRGLIEVG
jgi:NitT/TauT family transport system permease protein